MGEQKTFDIEHEGVQYTCNAEVTRDDAQHAIVTVKSGEKALTVRVLRDGPCGVEPYSLLFDAIANKVRDKLIAPLRPLLREQTVQAFADHVEQVAGARDVWSNELFRVVREIVPWAKCEPSVLTPETALSAVATITSANGDARLIVVRAASGRAKLHLGQDILPGELTALCTLRAGASYPTSTAPIPCAEALAHLKRMRIEIEI